MAIDEDIQFLLQRLRDSGMMGYVNVIITADHGITLRPPGNRQIEIGKVLRRAKVVKDIVGIVGSGAYTMIYPKEDPQMGVLDSPASNIDRRNRVVREINKALKELHMENQAYVYKKEDIPDTLHWRVGDKIVVKFKHKNHL